MSDDNRKKGGRGRPQGGSGFGRDRKGPSRGGSRPDGRGFKSGGFKSGGFKGKRAEGDRADGKRSEGRRFSDRGAERSSSPDTMIKGAFRPRKPRDDDAARPDRRSEGRPSSESIRGDGGKRRFSPSKGPRRSFRDDASAERSNRPFRERPARDRSFGERSSGERSSGERPFREKRFDRPHSDQRGADRRGPDRRGPDRRDSDRRGADRRSGRSTSRPAPKARPGDRIAKVMARVGLCSRRDAEAWILEGRVVVNGEILTSPARDIVPTDKVEVDGKPLPLRERTRLFLYHKSRGLVTTARDPEGRPTVFAHLPKGLPRLISVGRLDINTEGLLLLTNDGGLARLIELPETGWLRRYRVRCFGEIDQATLDSLRDGVTIDGMHYGPIEATLDREKGDNVWLTLGLREGKNREVKRVLEHFGLAVNRLIRVSFGPFQLGELAEGAVEEVRTGFLKHQISPEMVAESGVDFDGPIFNHDEDFDDIAPRMGHDRRRDDRGRDRNRDDRERRSFGRDDRRRDDTRRDDRRHDDRRRDERSRDDRGREESRPSRFDRTNATPRFEKGAAETQQDDAPKRPQRPHRNVVQKKIWRADDVETLASTRSTPKIPRRGTDPQQARKENAERTHQRAGRIQSRSGKSVMVEKLSPRSRNDEPRMGSKSGKSSRKPSGKPSGSSSGKPTSRPPRSR